MTVDHPTLLIVAALLSLFFVLPVGRFFFGHREQLLEDAGLSTKEDRWLSAYYFALTGWIGNSSFILGTIMFVVVMAAICTGLYKGLVWLFV